MGTKAKPGKFDCYAAARPDEEMFTLLARDPLAPILVRLWADMRERERGPSDKVTEARQIADTMEAWRTPARRCTAICGDYERLGSPCWCGCGQVE